MIDFTKQIINSNKFRQPALMFQRIGMYCTAPKGTTEYIRYWDQEKRRCIDGYTAEDGDFITGYNYFYLNYCPIVRREWITIINKKGETIWKQRDTKTFPDFYDYDYFYFLSIEKAEELGKHLCVAKSRRKGFSYKGGSMCCRNFYLIPDSKSYVYAANKQYLTDDGILTKAWDYMDFIDEYTAWGKKRHVANTSMRRRASFIVTDQFGNKTEAGYKSEIIGVSLKDNPDTVRGKRGKLILFEEAGSFPELAAAWQIARPSVEQDGIAFGLMVMFGTGGDEGVAIQALKTAFYNPDAYNCLEFDNIWDEGLADKKCGFFVPQHTNLDIRDVYGKRLYMDEDGNTYHHKAQSYILDLRHKELENASDTRSIDRYIAERCESPTEAFMELTGNIFPKKEMQVHLANIRINKKLTNHKQVGDLIWANGQVQWHQKKQGDLKKYKLSPSDDPTGAIVIWEHPIKDAPFGLYIAGIDPFDHDISGTNSLGSIFIYKRFQNFEEYYDLPVAEYTGRPNTAEEFYENVRKLLTYYNAKALCENQNKGLITYFRQKHSEHLLADQPDIIRDIIGNSKVERAKGIHMTNQIKDAFEGWLKDWLNEEYAPGKKNLIKILSEPLLEELISYNRKGNFDRVIAFGLVMIYIQQLHNIHVKHTEGEDRKRKVFEVPLFGTEYWADDSIDQLIKSDTQIINSSFTGWF